MFLSFLVDNGNQILDCNPAACFWAAPVGTGWHRDTAAHCHRVRCGHAGSRHSSRLVLQLRCMQTGCLSRYQSSSCCAAVLLLVIPLSLCLSSNCSSGYCLQLTATAAASVCSSRCIDLYRQVQQSASKLHEHTICCRCGSPACMLLCCPCGNCANRRTRVENSKQHSTSVRVEHKVSSPGSIPKPVASKGS